MGRNSTSLVIMLAIMLASFLFIQLVNADCVFMSRSNSPLTFPQSEPIKAEFPNINIHDICDQFNVGDYVCCNASQVQALSNNFPLVHSVFGSCPACELSMRRMWCGFACSTNQNEFITITKMNADGSVASVNFTLSNEFANGMWDACLDVRMGTAQVYQQFDVHSFLALTEAPFPYHTPLFTLEYKDYNKSDSLAGFLTETIPCEQMCKCDSCAKACHVPVVFTGCTVFGTSCITAGLIAMGVLGGLFLLAVMYGIADRVLAYHRQRQQGAFYQPINTANRASQRF